MVERECIRIEAQYLVGDEWHYVRTTTLPTDGQTIDEVLELMALAVGNRIIEQRLQ